MDEHATTSRQLREALVGLGESQRLANELRGRLDLALTQLRRDALMWQEMETIRAERDRLRTRMEALRALISEDGPDDASVVSQSAGRAPENGRAPHVEVVRPPAPDPAAGRGRDDVPSGLVEGLTSVPGGPVRSGSMEFEVPRYQVLGLISDGAMGRIYKARQTSLDRIVALKVLSRPLARNPDALARFQREAKLSARLSHPNIVQTIDAGNVVGVPYFVMEYVEGESIEQRLARQQTFGEKTAVGIVLQVADALRHADRRALVHRDIKPANVLLSDEGHVKLIDMGLARLTTDDAWTSADTGMAVGTPDYISPEQARGQPDVDIRSDIYSLGATLYRMVTGRVPYGGETPAEARQKHLDKDLRLTPPEEFNPELSPALGAVIRRMLARDRDDRYPHPDDLILDLRRVLQGHPPILEVAAASESLAIPGESRAEEGHSAGLEIRPG